MALFLILIYLSCFLLSALVTMFREDHGPKRIPIKNKYIWTLLVVCSILSIVISTHGFIEGVQDNAIQHYQTGDFVITENLHYKLLKPDYD